MKSEHVWTVSLAFGLLLVALISSGLDTRIGREQEGTPNVPDKGDTTGQDLGIAGQKALSAITADLGTGVSYQGMLTGAGGTPLNVTCNILFRLYDAPSGGTKIGSDSYTQQVKVTNGLFAAQANADDKFGWQAFIGQTRYLQVAVKCNSDTTYTYLSPRQAILGTLYALGLYPNIIVYSSSANLRINSAGGGYAISGENTTGRGVYGAGSIGVTGYSNNGTGVYAWSSSGTGLYAYGSGVADEMNLEVYSGGDLIQGWQSLPSSNRRFRVTSEGEVYADGSFHPGGADMAEMLPAVTGLEPGDVLVIGEDGKLQRCTQARQTNLTGVYSTKPGLLGGAGDDVDTSGQVPLAVVGVVPVKVSAENGAIRPGDLLTTSATPGHAMKASAMMVNSKAIYPDGIILGKALGSLTRGTGVIKVLIMLQ